MAEFVSIDISSVVASDEVRDLIARELSEFSWRRGDSDEQGKYLSGSSSGVQIRCWVDEKPMAMSISFRNSSLNAEERERLIASILTHVIPQFGQPCKIERK